jgi:hypothetical protein
MVQLLFAEFVWPRLSVARFRLLSMEAAALILARWIIENPAELVAQSRLGFALQNGQIRLFGLVASTFGRGFDFATAAAWHTHRKIDSACVFRWAKLRCWAFIRVTWAIAFFQFRR